MDKRPVVQVRRNLIDRIADAVSPTWGMKRFAARIQQARAEVFAASVGYVGGRYDRKSMQEWDPHAGSADTDTLSQQRTLRARSRDLTRNSPVGSAAAGTSVTHVVGTGLRFHSQPDGDFLGLGEDEVESKQREIERIWRTVRHRLDYEGTCTDAALQGLAFRSAFDSGDVLVVRRYDKRPGDLLGTKVQLIEADRINNPDGKMDSVKIAGGVEVNEKSGRHEAYHVSDRHPGDYLSMGHVQWSRVPVEGKAGVLARLLYHKIRPGQRRGVPELAPVIEPLKQVSRLADNELQAAVVSSLLTVFVKTEKQANIGDTGMPVAPEGTPEAEKPKKQGDMFLNPGAWIEGAPGEEIEVVDPKRPNGAFDPFFRALVQQIGAAIQVPYEVLMKLYQASYSAARGALLDAWRFFRTRRVWLAENYCQLVLEWVITEAVAEGIIDLPGFMSDPLTKAAWLSGMWVGDSPGQVDPRKEAEASEIRIKTGISNRAIECAEIMGRDWEEVHEQRHREVKREKKDGVHPKFGPGTGGASDEGDEGGEGDDDGGDREEGDREEGDREDAA